MQTSYIGKMAVFKDMRANGMDSNFDLKSWESEMFFFLPDCPEVNGEIDRAAPQTGRVNSGTHISLSYEALYGGLYCPWRV